MIFRRSKQRSPAANRPRRANAPFKGLQYFDVQDATSVFWTRGADGAIDRANCASRARRRWSSSARRAAANRRVVRAGDSCVAAVRCDGTARRKRRLEIYYADSASAGSAGDGAHARLRIGHRDRDAAGRSDARPAALASVYSDDSDRDHRPPTDPHRTIGVVRFLLVVDQFEELFTLCRDEFERQAFIDNLLYALTPPRPHLLSRRRGAKGRGVYPHPHPPRRLLRASRAISRTARCGGAPTGIHWTDDDGRTAPRDRGTGATAAWEFEPGLVDLILRDVGDEPGALPLALARAAGNVEARGGHTLTLKGYPDAGGVRGAIAHTAERRVRKTARPNEQEIARNIFLRLTELGEGTEDTRRRASFDELMPERGNRR